MQYVGSFRKFTHVKDNNNVSYDIIYCLIKNGHGLL